MSRNSIYDADGGVQNALDSSFERADTPAGSKVVDFVLSMLSKCRHDNAKYSQVISYVNRCLSADQLAEVCQRQMEDFDRVLLHLCVEHLCTDLDDPGFPIAELEDETLADEDESERNDDDEPARYCASKCVRCRGTPLSSALVTRTMCNGVTCCLCRLCDSKTRVAVCSYQDEEKVVLLNERDHVLGFLTGNSVVPPGVMFGGSYDRSKVKFKM